MNWKIIFGMVLAANFFCAGEKTFAQGTAFNYQGRLNVSGNLGSGAYDFRFQLYDAVTNGNAASLPQTNLAVNVAAGLFNATLDFGSVFTGTNYWLSIGVRTNGDPGSFTLLVPRQPLLPVPYAIFATSASNLLGLLPASQLSGALPSAQISGNYSGTVNFTNSANSFSGTFFGNGMSLTNLNGSQISSGTVADARLTTNVALLNRDQTFSGANNFTNNGNSFMGSFFGNGLVGWIVVSNTTVQAMRDAGYLLSSPALTSVTLPLNANLFPGDIVRVSGAGGGGWKVLQNSGQFISGNFASYTNATLGVLSGAGIDCQGVAATADGVRIYAVGNGLTGVWASSNGGRTWAQVSSTGGTGLSGSWYSVACSADGKIVYAEPYSGGTIQKSTDSGVDWSATGSSATGTFISCPADGSAVFTGNIACSGNGTYRAKLASGVITISTNSGANYNLAVSAPASGVSCLGVSSDCTRLVAGVNNGLLYASSNRGVTWTPINTGSQVWSGAWMSPDGTKFAGTIMKSGSINGGLYSCEVSVLPNTSTTVSTGSLNGSEGSAAELQYIGNGQFMPVSSAGVIWAN